MVVILGWHFQFEIALSDLLDFIQLFGRFCIFLKLQWSLGYQELYSPFSCRRSIASFIYHHNPALQVGTFEKVEDLQVHLQVLVVEHEAEGFLRQEDLLGHGVYFEVIEDGAHAKYFSESLPFRPT